MTRRVTIAFIVIVCAIGIWARFAGLGTHFSHVDDIGVAKSILDHKALGYSGIFAVPTRWTYAPFQFIFTSFIINIDQSYRELLFWGRVPSFVFSSLALLAWIFFYQRYNRWQSAKGLVALTLLAISWENIIFAKQMHNYALGVLAIIILFIMFWEALNRERLSWWWAIGCGFLLALLVNMQYSILFFLPAFFVILFINHLKEKTWVNAATKYVVAFLVFLLLLSPTWHYFLKSNVGGGISGWNVGPDNIFLFQWNDQAGFIDNMMYTARFYAINAWLIFRSMTAFIAEKSIWVNIVGSILALFAVAGMVSCWHTKEQKKPWLGWFMVGVAITWIILVASQRLTFSPTRHQLVLLPFMAYLVGEGMEYIIDRFKTSAVTIKRYAYPAITVGMLIIFLANFGGFLKIRKDVFNEEKILDILKRYHVNAVITAEWLNHLDMMKSVRDYFHYYQITVKYYSLISDGPQPYDTIAWVSQSYALTPGLFEGSRQMVNKYISVVNNWKIRDHRPTIPLLTDGANKYHPIFKEEISLDTEVEYSSATRNGSNALYLYILKKR